MSALVRLSLSLLEAAACASRRTIVVLCSIVPWLSLACVLLPRSGPLTLRPLPGLRKVGRLTASTMLLCPAPGTAAPGSVVVICTAPREARGSAPCSLHVVDSAGGWEDHFLVALRVSLAIRWAPRGTQWKVEGVDRAALNDPACCYQVQGCVEGHQVAAAPVVHVC